MRVVELHGADEIAVARRALDRDHALGAAALAWIVGKFRAFAKAVLGCGQDIALAFGHDHRHDARVRSQTNATHARCSTAHRAYFVLGEAHGFAVRGEQHHVARAVGELHIDQCIAFIETNRDLAFLQLEREFGQRRFLHRAMAGGEKNVTRGRGFTNEIGTHRQHGLHLLAFLQLQQVDDRPAARVRTRIRDFVYFQPVHTAKAGERKQNVVRIDHPQTADEILFLDRGGHAPLAAALLCAIDAHRLALGVAGVRERDDDVFRRDQVEHVEIFLTGLDHGAACIAILLLDLVQFIADHLQQAIGIHQDLDQAGDRRQQFLVLVGQFFLFEPGEPGKAHFENLLRLHFGQLVPVRGQADVWRQVLGFGRIRAGRREEAAHETRLPASGQHALFGFVARRRGLDQLDHLVDVGECNGQAFEHVGAIARLAQFEDRAPRDHFAAVTNERVEDFLEVEQARLAIDQRDHVDAECDLHLRLLIQIIEQHVRHRVLAHFDDDAHAVLVGLVAQTVGRDALEFLFLVQLGDRFDQALLVHLIGQFSDDDRLAAVVFGFDVRLRAHENAPASGLVGFDNAGCAVDDAVGGKIRARYQTQQRVETDIRIVDRGDAGVDDFDDIVRRHVGRHADRDAGRAVDEQVRQARRQHARL